MKNLLPSVLLIALALTGSQPARGDARLSSDGQTIVDRVRAAGGREGLIRFALGWNNRNDLDLHCVDPRGEKVYYHHPKSASGGVLDVDRNAAFPYRTDPVENVRWLADAPAGKYEVYVVYYAQHGDPDPTAYRVVAQVGDETREITGSISASQGKQLVGEFEFASTSGSGEGGWFLPLVFLVVLSVAVRRSAEIKNEVARTALFLALGGVLAFFPSEPVQAFATTGFVGYLIQESLYFLVVGVVLATFLAAFDGVSVGSYSKALNGARKAAWAGALGGAIGGAVGQILFQVLAGASAGFIAKFVARVLGWGLVGGFVGSGPGIVSESRTRVFNGVLGGVIGGAIGGFAFCFFGGRLGRLISLCILGASIGLLIRAVEAVRKRAWLMRIRGYPEGKEWPVDKDEIVIGANELVDVCLLRDPKVTPRHAVIKRGPEGYTVAAMDGPIEVNETAVTAVPLKDGDRITIGGGALVFRTESGAPVAEPVVAPAAPVADPFPPGAVARLVNVRGGLVLYLMNVEVMVGSKPDAGLLLTNEGIEATHALIKRSGNDWFIFDKSKGTGVWVNGTKITQRTALPAGAILLLGPLELRFEPRP